MNTVIYGAQGIALGTYKAIKTIFSERPIQCFLVTELADNAPMLAGLPVRELAEFISGMTQEEKNHIQVLIATPENVMEAIEKSLDEAGLYCHVRIDSRRWAQMQELAFVKTGEYMPLVAYPAGYHQPLIHVYKMVHHKDKSLSSDYADPDYMISLQVGATNAEERVAVEADNVGYNISDKNGNYSELTGLYWIWKNRMQNEKYKSGTYYGLCHYRRQLDLSQDDPLRLIENDIDVVLPYPMPYEPNIEAHHERYLSEKEWNAVLQALEELQPEYAKSFQDILNQEYLYNYNIILAKAQVLDDYCSWLFPILFKIEQILDPEGTRKPNRYIGYIGETLETLYFVHNKKKLRIAHAGCRFLV